MKKLIFILCLLPLTTIAQTKQDYMDVMSRYVSLYNEHAHDKICELFPEDEERECFWKTIQPGNLFDEYGPIDNYSWLGPDKTDPDGGVRVFKITFRRKGVKAMSFSLIGDDHFGTFRFDTNSAEIERMLAAAEE